MLLWPWPSFATEQKQDFKTWLVAFRADAKAAGISENTLEAALGKLEQPEKRVVALDRNQPEFKRSLADYIANRVNNRIVAKGRKMLKRYPTWLGRVEQRHKVQRRFLVSLWGIESQYGAHSGKLPVINSLASLSYDGRRGEYFRTELIDALHIIDDGHISLERMKGSWAGALGQCQFMPSTFRAYALDADGDGRINLWDSIPDVFASAANYLSASGWKIGQTWGREVQIPKNFDSANVGLDQRLPLARWQALGVRRINGDALPQRDLQASLILPEGEQGPAYLVYDNFRVLRRWNRSNSFAITVGILADELAKKQ